MKIEKPEVPQDAYYKIYIHAAKSDDLISSFQLGLDRLLKKAEEFTEEQLNFAYQEGKWTLKEVLVHCNDVERILGTRALMLARGEQQELQGFDEDIYGRESMVEHRTLQNIITEFAALRTANIALFQSFNDEQVNREGVANGLHFSVRMLGWMLSGHSEYHLNFIEEKYLVA